MTKEEIESFIRQLDSETENYCVYPDKMTSECEDCYLCRVDYFNWVRKDLIDKYGLEN